MSSETIAALIGALIGGLGSVWGGIYSANRSSSLASKKSREKTIYHLRYCLSGINEYSKFPEAYMTTDALFLSNDWYDDLCNANFPIDEADKITKFFAELKDLKNNPDAGTVQKLLRLESVYKSVEPLIKGIEGIIIKYSK